MKTISLRTFRVAVDRLDEPVQVVKREDGELRVLGTWMPASDGSRAAPGAGAIAGFGTSRPAPKPQRGAR